jgi:hypothetical protein
LKVAVSLPRQTLAMRGVGRVERKSAGRAYAVSFQPGHEASLVKRMATLEHHGKIANTLLEEAHATLIVASLRPTATT